MPCLGQNVAEFGVTRLMETASGMVENRPGFFEHRVISIQPKKPPLWPEFGENPRGVPTPANSPVDDGLPRLDTQPLQHLCHKDRDMAGKRRSRIK
jgi:hypothetical protein